MALSGTASTMPAVRPSGDRWVRVWLWIVALLVMAMVVVGGATRLTGSGLSITEWQPILGAFPPLTDADWHAAFEKYKAIPQYRLLNQDMDLAGFQFIYWWEWSHRLLGRTIGFVFAVPMLVFLRMGAIGGKDLPAFAGLFLLGGLQGAIGWWMVASGLADRTEVAPYRLAVHLTVAAIIFVLCVIMAERRRGVSREAASPATRRGANALVVLILIQLFLGALVAGNRAGLVYNTWPLMDGAILPAESFAMTPVWRNFFENHALVQFIHRLGAYIVFGAVLIHGFRTCAMNANSEFRTTAFLVLLAATLQAGLGILTLILQVPLALALAHQVGAVILLGLAVIHRMRIA